MNEKEKQAREFNRLMDSKVQISRRDAALVGIIIVMFLCSTFTMGYIIRGFEDEKILINVLAWWKLQRDCSQCGEWECMGTVSKLSAYNLSLYAAPRVKVSTE
jgi:hypothetical protein